MSGQFGHDRNLRRQLAANAASSGHFLIRLSENGYLDNCDAPENFEHMAEKISPRYVEIRGLFGFRCT